MDIINYLFDLISKTDPVAAFLLGSIIVYLVGKGVINITGVKFSNKLKPNKLKPKNRINCAECQALPKVLLYVEKILMLHVDIINIRFVLCTKLQMEEAVSDTQAMLRKVEKSYVRLLKEKLPKGASALSTRDYEEFKKDLNLLEVQITDNLRVAVKDKKLKLYDMADNTFNLFIKKETASVISTIDNFIKETYSVYSEISVEEALEICSKYFATFTETCRDMFTKCREIDAECANSIDKLSKKLENIKLFDMSDSLTP